MAFHTYYVLVCVDQERNFVQDYVGHFSPSAFEPQEPILHNLEQALPLGPLEHQTFSHSIGSVLLAGFPLVALCRCQRV